MTEPGRREESAATPGTWTVEPCFRSRSAPVLVGLLALLGTGMLKVYVAAAHRVSKLRDQLAALKQDQSKTSTVEYALLVGMIAVAAFAALTTLKPTVGGAFSNISNKL